VSVWAVIPVRATPDSKSRLAAVLDAPARARLVDAMLDRVIAAARGARIVAEVCTIGSARAGVIELAEPGGGLNAAATAALAQVARRGATRAILVHADLPHITPRDLELLAAAPPGGITIAPDRHGTGTNAISLPLPQAEHFAFAFGPDSFARHASEAQRHGLKIAEVRSPGLACDIDEPADLADIADLLG
jgi:2-phospho-L-lactate guanylyltransferase